MNSMYFRNGCKYELIECILIRTKNQNQKLMKAYDISSSPNWFFRKWNPRLGMENEISSLHGISLRSQTRFNYSPNRRVEHLQVYNLISLDLILYNVYEWLSLNDRKFQQ